MNKITLEWNGPFKLNKLKDLNHENILLCGVYLWTIKLEQNKYGVYYVGESSNIKERLKHEISEMEKKENGSYIIYYEKTKNIDLIYKVFDEKSINDELIENNKNLIEIFYCNCENHKQVEGAIVYKLRMKHISRQYLNMQQNINSDLNPNDINNIFKNGVEVIGLNC